MPAVLFSACEGRDGGYVVVGGVLRRFLLTGDASERQTVVTGGVMRLLAVEASDGGISTVMECPIQAKACQVSGGGTLEMGSSILGMVGCLLFFSKPVMERMVDE